MSVRQTVAWCCDRCGREVPVGKYASVLPDRWDRWRTVKFEHEAWHVCGGCAATTLRQIRALFAGTAEPSDVQSKGPYR